MNIGEVAARCGLAASAIRYYEKAGILPRAPRAGGRRRYDDSILERLAVVERAKDCGFTLPEIRELFHGFRPGTPPSARWRRLSRRKLEELEALSRKIAQMKEMLESSCNCADLQECGRRLIEHSCK